MNIVISPFIIALPIGLVIILLLPPIFEKYTIKLDKSIYAKDQQHYFHDLDHDNHSELIRTCDAYGLSAFPYISCYRDYVPGVNHDLIGQFNWGKPFLKISRLMFGDYDNDQSDEIYFFSYSNDSVFLDGLDPLNQRRFFLDRFITTATFREGQPDFEIFNGGLHDIDNNGYKEVIFTITAGFSLYPRTIYVYDIYHDSLYKSDNQDAYFVGRPQIVTHNGISYILSASYAAGNIKDSTDILYSDYSSWLFLFDHKLDPVFTPIENRGFRSGIYPELFTINNELLIAAAYRHQEDTIMNCVILYNLAGRELARTEWNTMSTFRVFPQYFQEKNTIPILNLEESTIYFMDDQLQVKKRERIENIEPDLFPMDIDIDGELEFLLRPGEINELIIFRNDLKHPAKINFPCKSGVIPSVRLSEKGKVNLLVYCKDNCYYYIYEKNPFYYMKFPFYFAIYLVIALFFNLLFKLQRKSVQKKYEQERKIMELELMTIKNQMDPHFIFNAINSISSVMYNEDRKVAYGYMVDFANLIRSSLVNSKNISLPLSDEIEFVKNYLRLQQLRHNYKFDYKIEIDENVSRETIIPKMIIQTFAENAVKHGLAHLEENGQLFIRIFKDNFHIIINIEDNGVGREKAKELSKRSTGKGMEIIDQILELYLKLQKTAVTYQVKDLYTEDRATGTSVTIKIPTDKH